MKDAQDRQSPWLLTLKDAAERLAESRGERGHSGHLLAALLDADGVAAELLRGKCSSAAVLKHAAGGREELTPLLQRATQIAKSMRSAEALDVHLLIALMNARESAAHKALQAAKLDLVKLRVTAMNAGLGLIARRSSPPRAAEAARAANGSSVVAVKPRLAPHSDAPAAAVTTKATRVEPSRGGLNERHNKRRAASQSSRFALDPRRHKLLRSLGRNLTLMAENGELPEVIGRETEVSQLLDVLAKSQGNNPCLVGMPGVGKSSVVYALARHAAAAAASNTTDGRIVVELDVAALLAGTGVRGALSQRLMQLRSEVAASQGRVVLFVDDIHQLFGADASEELTSELKRALASGDLPCIGATSPSQFAHCLEADAALQRRFTRVEVSEPDADTSAEILELAARRCGAHHQVEYDAASLASAIAWSTRYVPGRALPDKAISVIDLAGARARRRGEVVVTNAQVADVITELASVPRERLLESDGERLLRLEQTMAERVVGHAEAMKSICRIIRRNGAGLHAARPIGTFLLLGPTGVGKTETAKALAEVLFGSEQAMTRFDLSEYSEAHAVARLIGAPPGYVGFEAGGQLTEAVRKRPYQVVLLDEIEKAHPDVLATFLPLFDEGRLTDGRGRTVDFTNVVLFLTSNLGAEAAMATTRRLGFAAAPNASTEVAAKVTAEARRRLSPEFFNRLDEVLVFDALSEAEIEGIARRMLQRLADRVYEQRGVELLIEANVVTLLLAQGGYDRTLGARPMRRAIARLVEAPLAEALLRNDFKPGHQVRLSATAGHVLIAVESVAAE